MNPNSFTLKDTKSLLHCEASSVATEHAVTVKEKWKGDWRGKWRREGHGVVAEWGEEQWWCEMRMAVALVVMVVMEGEGAGVGY